MLHDPVSERRGANLAAQHPPFRWLEDYWTVSGLGVLARSYAIGEEDASVLYVATITGYDGPISRLPAVLPGVDKAVQEAAYILFDKDGEDDESPPGITHFSVNIMPDVVVAVQADIFEVDDE